MDALDKLIEALGLPEETEEYGVKFNTKDYYDGNSDELDAQLAFLNEEWLISVDRATMLERDKFENWTDEMRSAYARWLMAKAKERPD